MSTAFLFGAVLALLVLAFVSLLAICSRVNEDTPDIQRLIREVERQRAARPRVGDRPAEPDFPPRRRVR